MNHSRTATYWFIESALDQVANSFQQLDLEMNSFVPRARDSFAQEEAAELHRMIGLNPSHDVHDLEEHVREQFEYRSSESHQVQMQFGDRITAVAVSAIVLSHALCEAVINAVLAIGLFNAGKADLFYVLESANLKRKWTAGPVSFLPDFKFPKSDNLYGRLQSLCAERNSLVHSRVTISSGGQKLMEGSRDVKLRIDTVGRQEIKGRLRLPYDLLEFLCKQVKDQGLKFQFEMILRK